MEGQTPLEQHVQELTEQYPEAKDYLNALKDRTNGVDNAYKQVVKYRDLGIDIQPGFRATVVVLDHPSPFVTNGQIAHTSKVIEHDPTTGTFVTQNSIYIKASNDE